MSGVKWGYFFRFEHFAWICRYDGGNFRFYFWYGAYRHYVKILFPVGDKSSYPKIQWILCSRTGMTKGIEQKGAFCKGLKVWWIRKKWNVKCKTTTFRPLVRFFWQHVVRKWSFQVSGVGCQASKVLNSDTWNL